MTLKGRYDPKTQYKPGDVVLHDNGEAYQLRNPAKAGVPPVDTAYWQRLNDTLSTCASWIIESQEDLRSALAAKAPAAKTTKGGKAK